MTCWCVIIFVIGQENTCVRQGVQRFLFRINCIWSQSKFDSIMCTNEGNLTFHWKRTCYQCLLENELFCGRYHCRLLPRKYLKMIKCDTKVFIYNLQQIVKQCAHICISFGFNNFSGLQALAPSINNLLHSLKAKRRLHYRNQWV